MYPTLGSTIFTRRATRILVFAVALAILAQAIVVTRARADDQVLVCGSEFDDDVFAAGWERTQPEITSANGILTIPSVGGVDDRATMPCLLAGWFEVHVRARIVAGGQNYVFPGIAFHSLLGEELFVNVLPNSGATCPEGPSLHGWRLKDDVWSGVIPHKVACEGQWMTMRIVVGQGHTSAGTRLSDAQPFLNGATMAGTPAPIVSITLQQPWNAHIEVDHVRVYAASPLPALIEAEGIQTRSALNDTRMAVVAEHQATRDVLGDALMEETDALAVTVRSEANGTAAVISNDGNVTRQAVNDRADGIEAAIAAEHETTRGRLTQVRDDIAARIDVLTAWLDARFAAMDARFDALGSRLDARFASLETRFDTTDDKLDDIFHAVQDTTDATPLQVSLTAGSAPGTWYALVTLRGAPTNVTIEADGLSIEHLREGVYAIDATAQPLALEEQVVTLIARDGSHVGSALVIVPPLSGRSLGPSPISSEATI